MAIIIGGPTAVYNDLRRKLASRNIEARYHVDYERGVSAFGRIPSADVDIAIVVRDIIAHEKARIATAALGPEVTVMTVAHKWTFLAVALNDRGYASTVTHPALVEILGGPPVSMAVSRAAPPVLAAVPSPPPPPTFHVLSLGDRLRQLAGQLFEECAASGFSVLVTPDDLVITPPKEGQNA